MEKYSELEKKSLFEKIDAIEDKKILADLHDTLNQEYNELFLNLESINNKFNYLLTSISIIFSLTIVVIPSICQPTSIAKDNLSLILGMLLGSGVFLLLLIMIALLLKFRKYREYRKFDEGKLIELAEYYSVYSIYQKEKIKGLTTIINYNHTILEERKNELRQFGLPIIISLTVIFLTAPIILYRADDPSYIKTIVDAIKLIKI